MDKRKVVLQEAKLKAKGLNPDGTPALSTLGGFSPGSKPCKLSLPLPIVQSNLFFLKLKPSWLYF